MIKESAWITPCTGIDDGAAEFVKHISVKGDIKKAALVVTAIGVYDAYINGRRVGDFILAPGCTAYNKRLQYQAYDITGMLDNENELVITVGKGWHRSRMSENRPEINTKPCALIAQITLEYKHGKTETVCTDKAWKCRRSRIVFNDIWDGETYDASLKTGELFDVKEAELDKSVLIEQEGEKVCEREVFLPQKLIITPKGEKVLDFGQEITGYVEFSVNAKAGETVELSCGEVLDADGNFYNDNYRSAKSKMKYICADGKQTWKPRMTFYGFRYIRIDAYPGDVDADNFRAIAVYSDIERSGYIKTSNEKVNKLFENTLWSQRDNFLDIPTDCPQRDERMGWTGDAQVFAKTACYNFNTKRFFEKWLADLRAEQRTDGSIPDTVPNFWKIMRSSAAWGDAMTVIPWQVYLMYGDKKTLEDNFDAMKAWVDFMGADSLDKYLWTCPDDSDKMWRKHYGDWLALDAPNDGWRGKTPDNFIASAFYAYSTDILVRAGKALGRDMSEYEKLHGNIVKTFKNTFNELTTQTEHTLALCFGLTDDREKTAAKLAKMIRENGNKLKTGFVGTPYLMYALSENGYADVAYDLLLQEEYPSWLYEVNHGATTVWEHWDGIKEDGTFWSTEMNSFNHYAYGSVCGWIYSHAGGIRPDENAPGFERVIIAPVITGKIDGIEVKYRSVKGDIVSKWQNTPNGVRYEITAPVPITLIIDGKVRELGAGSYTFGG